nr:hypothetical protein [Gluconobacter thailandicus]
MVECTRKCSNHPEAKTLPKRDCAVIGAYDKIELHGPVTEGLRFFQGELAHLATCTVSGTRNKTRIPDVSAAAQLIVLKIKSPDNFTFRAFCHVHPMLDSHPVPEGLSAPPCSW